jgi:CheY-like chemotaxis protein
MTTPLRILHLEDDANDAELIAMQLAAHKHEWPHDLVQVSTEGEFSKALDQSPFEIILADNSGPAFNGENAVTLARQKQPQAVFLFVSGYAEESPEAVALKKHADSYVVKDKLKNLVPTIQKTLQSKQK